jgi:hypothetical protein
MSSRRCRHCGRHAKHFGSRGLCNRCYRGAKSVRHLYPSESKFGRWADGLPADDPLPPATGTIEYLQARAARRLPLFA